MCLSTLAGGGYPIPGLVGGTPSQVWQGGTPSQVWPGGTPSQVWPGGYPSPTPGMGYPPDQGQGTPWIWDGVPPRTWDRVPPLDLGQGIPPRPGTGYLPDLGWGTPPQHSEHLLRGGRYASCVHAGGLSCTILFTNISTMLGATNVID